MSDSGSNQHASRVIPREYVTAFILVTSLFFMWAIAHNMNDILIRQFQKALDLSRGQASFIQVSFYLAYFFAAIPAGYAMKKLGFKRAILIGLLLYALGAALFYPAAAVGNYAFFLAALFIIATGIVFLETSGSGYITLVGDPATAARRINFAQSFNGLGGFIAPLIGGVFIFSGIELAPDAIDALSSQALLEYRALEARQVQLPYLLLAGILLFVALLVAVTRFPASGVKANSGSKPSLAGVFAHRSFVWAIVAQFFYVGAQIGVWSYFIDFTKELTPLTREKTAAFYLSASLLSFMVGRFIGTYLMKYIAPRSLLGLYALINIGLVGVALVTSGLTAVIALGATSFFMSIMFPTIYALGLEHLGDKAEMGSSLIIMTIISGAIIPPMMGYLSDSLSVQWAYLVPLVCYFMVWLSTRLGGLEQSGGKWL
jgi:MFS transporter, FHS family, L-fucose permease